MPFDTTGLSNGAHHLVVSVLDAAGNSAPVLDREIDVDNPIPPPPPGTAERHERLRAGDVDGALEEHDEAASDAADGASARRSRAG